MFTLLDNPLNLLQPVEAGVDEGGVELPGILLQPRAHVQVGHLKNQLW